MWDQEHVPYNFDMATVYDYDTCKMFIFACNTCQAKTFAVMKNTHVLCGCDCFDQNNFTYLGRAKKIDGHIRIVDECNISVTAAPDGKTFKGVNKK